MLLEDITLALFTVCNSLRVVAYIPQMRKAATDTNGASAISRTTWNLFLVAHLSTVLYAIVNRGDWTLAACFMLNAACCVAILVLAHRNRRRFLSVARDRNPARSAPRQAAQLRFSAFHCPEQTRPPDDDQVPVPDLPDSRPVMLARSWPREMLAETDPLGRTCPRTSNCSGPP